MTDCPDCLTGQASRVAPGRTPFTHPHESMRSASRGLVFAATMATLVIAATGGCTARSAYPARDAVAELTDGFDVGVRRDIETLRAATNKYHDLKAAEAAGYPSKMPMCIADATMGGMGHHFVDRTLFDDKLEIERPEMLIYAPVGDGKVELVAVEYVVPFRVLPASEKPPRLFGQAFKPYDEYKYWALHVWAWRRNSAGLFADWNPAVKCPR